MWSLPTLNYKLMVDYSLKEPWEVLEDVIVVVGMFSYPMSFVVMKWRRGWMCHSSLEDLFFLTSKAKVGVFKGKFKLEVNGARKRWVFICINHLPLQKKKDDVVLQVTHFGKLNIIYVELICLIFLSCNVVNNYKFLNLHCTWRLKIIPITWYNR